MEQCIFCHKDIIGEQITTYDGYICEKCFNNSHKVQGEKIEVTEDENFQYANGIKIREKIPYKQTTTQIYIIMEYIKSHQLPSPDILQLIHELEIYNQELIDGYKRNEENEEAKEL